MLVTKPLRVDAEQRSAQWYEARFGRVTGSEVSSVRGYYQVPSTKAGALMMERAIAYHTERFMPEEVMARMIEEYPQEFVVSAGIELQETAARSSYRMILVTERLTRMPPEERYLTSEMRWGIMNEDAARTIYQTRNQMIVEDAPFLIYRTLDTETNEVVEWMAGASPDGYATDPETGELGVIEIKNLASHNHLYKIIMEHDMPDDYFDQVQMEMLAAGVEWCDFIGYDSRVPEGLRLFIKRIERDEFFIKWVLLPSIKRFLDEVDRDEAKFRAIQSTPLEKRKSRKELDAEETSLELSIDA